MPRDHRWPLEGGGIIRSRRLPLGGGADRPQQRRHVPRDGRLLRVLHERQVGGIGHALRSRKVCERAEDDRLQVAEVDCHLR